MHTTETLEEPEADTTEMASISLDIAVDSIEELTIDEPIAIDETASVEPVLEIGKPDQEPTSFIDTETGNFNLDLPAISEEIIAIDETASVEPVLEIGEPDEEPPLSIEPPLEISEPEKTIFLEPALEIGEPEETPSIEPALDLGKNEIALDLDDNPSITPAPPVAAAPLDEV